MDIAKRGDWVQIGDIILSAGQRAPNIPDETQAVPLTMKVKGFLKNREARLGDLVKIDTLIGREIAGNLIMIAPAYTHSFGLPCPELMNIGLTAKKILDEAK